MIFYISFSCLRRTVGAGAAKSTVTARPASIIVRWTWWLGAKSEATDGAAPSSHWTTARPRSATEKAPTTAAPSLGTAGQAQTTVTAQSAPTTGLLPSREVNSYTERFSTSAPFAHVKRVCTMHLELKKI